jgi:4'-phosphopantetheinyl transferase
MDLRRKQLWQRRIKYWECCMSIAPVPERQTAVFSQSFEPVSLDSLAGSIHVWRIPSDHAANDAASLRAILSADEIARAEKFHFAAHRDAFVINRARLRFVLSHYLGYRPESLSFAYGKQGKPVLVDAASHGLQFNLSHTDGVALVAVARHRQVGVDVERMRPSTEVLEIAKQHFSEAEYKQLLSLDASERLTAFYRCWTRKEAFLKALGEGMHRSLQGFQVSLLPGEPAALIACDNDPDLCRQWQLHSLDAGEGFIAALCHDGGPLTGPIQRFECSDAWHNAWNGAWSEQAAT